MFTTEDLIYRLDKIIELLENKVTLNVCSEVVQNNITYGEWLLQWYNLYKKPKLKSSTLRCYNMYIQNNLIPAFGNILLSSLNGNDIQKYLNSIPQNNTRVKLGNMLRSSLSKACKTKLLSSNPYDAVEIPALRSNHYKALGFDVQNQILSSIKNELYLHVFWVLVCSGLRIGEFVALDFDKDINYKDCEINVSKSIATSTKVIDTPKSKNSVRVVFFDKMLLPHLKYLKNFQKRNGNITYSMVSSYFKRLYKTLKIKGYNLHSFRHTFISLCYNVGIREKQIQILAGHSDINMTLNTYTHVLKIGKSPFLDYFKRLKNKLEKPSY